MKKVLKEVLEDNFSKQEEYDNKQLVCFNSHFLTKYFLRSREQLSFIDTLTLNEKCFSCVKTSCVAKMRRCWIPAMTRDDSATRNRQLEFVDNFCIETRCRDRLLFTELFFYSFRQKLLNLSFRMCFIKKFIIGLKNLRHFISGKQNLIKIAKLATLIVQVFTVL